MGDNVGYTMVPNPNHAGRQLVKCRLCTAGEGNPTFSQKSIFARHCDTQHPGWEHYATNGFRKCHGCNRIFVGQMGLRAHHRSSVACAAVAAPQQVGAGGVDDGEEEEEREYTEHELMAPFGSALYHIQKAWQDLFWNISVSLLKGMVPGPNCYINTLAFFLLPGIISFLNNQKTLGRVVDFLRSICSLETSTAKAQAIRREAIRLIECQSKGDCVVIPKPPGVDGVVKSIGTYIRGGRLSTGAHILDTISPQEDGPMIISDSAVLQLTLEERKAAVSNLHPRHRSDELDSFRATNGGDIDITTEPAGIVLDSATILQGIKLLSTDAANGACGWTNNSIKFLRMHHPDETKQNELAGAIGEVFKALSTGTMPSTVQGLWTRTRSVLLPKQPSGIRPIGIKSAWYRYFGKTIVSTAAADAGVILKGEGQLAVGLSGGCEVGARIGQICAIKAIRTAGTDMATGVIGIDCANCFNEIPLATSLEQMRTMVPGLVRTFTYLYKEPSELFGPEGVYVGNREIGTAQGCPLSMLIASLALVPVNREVLSVLEEEERKYFEERVAGVDLTEDEKNKIKEELKSVKWSYADDLNIGGHTEVLSRALPQLGPKYAQYGLRLVAHKSTGFHPMIEEDERFALLKRSNSGMVCLGSPIGTEEFRYEYVRDTLGDMKPNYKTLGLLPIRPGLLLLTYCYNARPEYLKRAVDPHVTHELLRDFDNSVDECLMKMVGEDPLTRERIGRLRGIKGGLGLGIRRHFGLTAEIGAQKSMVITYRFVHEFYPHLLPIMQQEGAWPKIILGGYENIELPAEITVDFEQDDPKLVAKGAKGALAEASRLAFEWVKEGLVAEGDKGKSAMAWVQSIYMVKGLPFWQSLEGIERGEWYFPSSQFRAMLRCRLLAPFLDVTGRAITHCKCCEAGRGGGEEVNIEDWYTHGMGCRWAANFSLRHNDVRDILEQFLKCYCDRTASGRPVISKEAVVHEGANGEPAVVMDLVYRETTGDQRVILVDVAVADPGCPTYIAENSHEQQGAAAKAREEDKIASFRQRCGDAHQAPHTLFYPFVIESSGRMGELARRFLRDVVRARDNHVRQLEKSLGMLLARHAGRSLNSIVQANWQVGAGGQGQAGAGAAGGQGQAQAGAAAEADAAPA